MSRAPANALPWLGVSALAILLDQWTKSIALAALGKVGSVAVVPGYLNWTLAFNTGAAFSFLADAAGWQRWVFAALALGVSLVLAIWLARTPRGDWRNALPFALIIGGAIGNLIDRLRLGHVVDFIHVHWHEAWHYPAFNVADSCITVGAVLLVFFGLAGGHRPRAE